MPLNESSRARAANLSRAASTLVTVVEAMVWSVVARVLLLALKTEQALRVLDALPRRRSAPAAVTPPPERYFRLAGACLGRSLARSQYLRVRGQPSVVVIGIRGAIAAFQAHAWLDQVDPREPDFVELRRIER